jgi:hypothetical protein
VLDVIAGPQEDASAGAAGHTVRDRIAFMGFDMRHEFEADIMEVDGALRDLCFWSYDVCGGSGGPFVDPADDEVNEVHKESHGDLEWKCLKNAAYSGLYLSDLVLDEIAPCS